MKGKYQSTVWNKICVVYDEWVAGRSWLKSGHLEHLFSFVLVEEDN
jgi:hypothetical protein